MSKLFALALFCSAPAFMALLLFALIGLPVWLCGIVFWAVFGLGLQVCTANDELRGLASQPDTEKK